MNRRARRALLVLILVVLAAREGWSQVVMQATPRPTVTAENELWYLNGEPITYAGVFYYPAGPQIFFNPNEMVRSGFYQGIPLYSRTTIEPYSIVYVPLANGRMQPYERPRAGELAETAGSLPATIPTQPATEPSGGLVPQAAGPPSQTARVVPYYVPEPAPTGSGSEVRQEDRRPVATAGRDAAPHRPMHVSIGGRPQGTNSIFIELQNRRWYPAGPAEPIDTSRMVRIDDYKGFEVWTTLDDRSVIYIPVTRGGTLAVPYTQTRQKQQVR